MNGECSQYNKKKLKILATLGGKFSKLKGDPNNKKIVLKILNLPAPKEKNRLFAEN